METIQEEQLVSVRSLRKLFPVNAGLIRKATQFIHAVDDVSFDIGHGDSLGLVGESGCGKTTTGRVIARLEDPTEGHVNLNDEGTSIDIAEIDKKGMKDFRSKVQMIFQDPFESLNPRRTVYDTIAEPLVVQGIGTLREREERVAGLLEKVGLIPPELFLFRYPHELSGGQRQRVAIARALVVDPTFVVADEPTSMLDVSIRISIMDLMLKLAEELDVSYLYITHDLAVARYMCNRIAVMYLGKIVEMGPTEEILASPLHPYTRALLSAVPVPDPSYTRPDVEIEGGISKAINPPSECRFLERCPFATEQCRTNPHPELVDAGGGHMVACYNAGEFGD
ncbi:MAG: ATP-binding cassette domain-containing protein [Acidimicrobiia bacterium]|nr:ATP-binding cassette domain-containing protein [Acidimicrobiia bacterium]